MNNKISGDLGEGLALDFLEKNKYRILETNFTSRTGEIDIIAEKDKIIVFVEVKSRRNLKYGRPCEAVTKAKIKKIIRVAEGYIMCKNIEDRQYRFDVIEVFLKEKVRINHIEDAFWL